MRNGYDRAFPTIIDTHLTSIFTAIVLYVVGNDQLKGFGISLTVGLIISLFTSLYVTRTIFDIWLGNNWLHKLYFMQLFKRPNINFMAIRYYFFAGTVIATILGAALFVYRLDKGGLNIDFVGGTAYSGQLVEPVGMQTLRNALEKPLTPADLKKLDIANDLPEVSIEQVFVNNPAYSQGDKSSLFTVRTSDKDAPKVQRVINYKLGAMLKRIEMKNPDIVAANGQTSEAVLEFVKSTDSSKPDYASPAQVTMLLNKEFKDLGVRKFTIVRAKGSLEQEGRFSKMKLDLAEPIPVAALKGALAKVQEEFHETPQPERLENFDRQLASDTQQKALYAIVASWAAILLYLWIRFGSWTFGAATVLCLIHDLFFTLGAIALCHWLHWIPILGEPVNIFGFPFSFGLADFKIDLPSVAALLTLVGYSVSDTIVVFDRIREVRGKNPLLTATMINDSVNQTLSRTILSSLTVFLVVGVLYAFGGEGVHLFAFVMVVGVIVGTYSSIYIASPLLLIFGEGTPKTQRAAKHRGGASGRRRRGAGEANRVNLTVAFRSAKGCSFAERKATMPPSPIPLTDPIRDHLRRDFIRLRSDWTVAQALTWLREHPSDGKIAYFYVLDGEDRLQGVAPCAAWFAAPATVAWRKSCLGTSRRCRRRPRGARRLSDSAVAGSWRCQW